MSRFLSLLPWLVYLVAGFFLTEQWSAAAAAAVSIVMVVVLLSRGRRPGEIVIELASTAFFVIYAVIAFARHGDPQLSRWLGPGSQLWLAAVVAGGMLVRRPFTLAQASRQVPDQVAGSEQFYRFNVRLTRIWLIAFVLSGLVLLAAALTHHSGTWLSVGCIVLTILIPSLLMQRLIKQAESRQPS